VTQNRVYVTPRAFLHGAPARDAVDAGWAWPLSGGNLGYAAIDISVREGGAVNRLGVMTRATYEKEIRTMAPKLSAAVEVRLNAMALSLPPFAGCDMTLPVVMGVLNVTPDSFSDGGKHNTLDAAIMHGLRLAEAGADIVDVGGESTRPGAQPVSEADELARVIPVILALAGNGVRVSIDTRHANVMKQALTSGATIVNDVSALTGDAASEGMVAEAKAPVVLMHMQGDPCTMQDAPSYVWAPGDVFDYLESRIAACVAAGIPASSIAVDPGIGFGKNDVHNAEILEHVAMFHGLGCALVLGVSRKGFIGRMSRGEAADQRLAGSLAAAVHAVGQGVQILRVHDVAETHQALAVAHRIREGVS
jgi:dihydropteroate synthase